MLRRCLFFLLPLAALIMTGCPVGPNIPVTEIRIYISNPSETNTIDQGSTLQLSAEITPAGASDHSVLWSTNNPKCAIVNQFGEVSGLLATDSVLICAESAANGITDVFEIIIKPLMGEE